MAKKSTKTKETEKKKSILKTAARLFAEQGFDATTTVQITKEAGVTEPLLYYHFAGKEDLLTSILDAAFTSYFSQLADLETDTDTAFEKIENLIRLHIKIVDENPHEARLVFTACPSKLQDPKQVWGRWIGQGWEWFRGYLNECLTQGIASGEFIDVPIPATGQLLTAFVVGLTRRRGLGLEHIEDMTAAAAAFCRRSLVATPSSKDSSSGGRQHPQKEGI